MITIKGKYNSANVMIDEIDESTLKQIQDFLNHPAFANTYISIMPDCLHPDTEALTEFGFKRINDLNDNDKIANYDPANDEIVFKKPIKIINRSILPNEKTYLLHSDRLGTLSLQTKNHRNAYIKNMGIITNDLPNETKIMDYKWSGKTRVDVETINDNVIKMIIWIVGDGNIKKTKNPKSTNKRIRFGLKKKRKIDKILELCKLLNITPFVNTSNKQTEIIINTDESIKFINLVGDNKEYPIEWIYKLSNRQKILLLDEAIMVDGDYEAYLKNQGFRLNSSNKNNIDFLSAISIDVGHSNIKTRKTLSNLTGKIHTMYYLNIIKHDSMYSNKNGLHSSKIKKVVLFEGLNPKKMVCVTCDTGYFVYRFFGSTGITGNCHAGSGAVIGFTMKLNDYIIPNVIGVDIGCGMLAAKFTGGVPDLKKLDNFIRINIPHGNNTNTKASPKLHTYSFDKGVVSIKHDLGPVCNKMGYSLDRALLAIGSLGGGNHFIEGGLDKDNNFWIVVHTGSRHFGKSLADFYQNKAKEVLDKFLITGYQKGLEYLPIEDQIAKDYIEGMKVATGFSSCNRAEILDRIVEHLGSSPVEKIESVHNYIDFKAGIIRKGAISAQKDEMCVIPFNMKDGIAICKGRGSSKYNYSAPHGAGRIYSRRQAKELLNLEEFKKEMDDANIYSTSISKHTLDEAPGAYKRMNIILENIQETVEVITMIKPVYNFKS